MAELFRPSGSESAPDPLEARPVTTHRLRNLFLAALLAVAAGAPVLGQSPPPSSGATRATLTDRGLEDLVSEALAKNPDIAASAATAEAASFRIAPARTLPDRQSISLRHGTTLIEPSSRRTSRDPIGSTLR